MKRLLLLIIALLPMMSMAQRTIENPIIGARSMGTCVGFFIDKIELSNTSTKLYLTNYHGYKEGQMMIPSGTTLRSGDKRWKVVSAEGINLDEPTFPKDNVEFVTHFVLNFPAIDPKLETVDYIESDDPNSFQLFDVALTDRAAAEIKKRNTVPDEVKNYAKNFKDNGESLDDEEFTMTPATIKGKFYGFDKRFFGNTVPELTIEVSVNNPLLRGRELFAAKLKDDNTYEITVPMTVKYQEVWMRISPLVNESFLIGAGQTVEVDFDWGEVYRPWEMTKSSLTPYYSGPYADINYALTQEEVVRKFTKSRIYDDEPMKKIADMTLQQFNEYLLNACNEECKGVDAMPFTKRAKEYLKLSLKNSTAYTLSMASLELPMWYSRVHESNGVVPLEKKPIMDKEFLSYPKTLDLDHMKTFCLKDFGNTIYGWNSNKSMVFESYHWYETFGEFDASILERMAANEKLSKKEKALVSTLARKFRVYDTNRTDEELALMNKYAKQYEKYYEAEKQRLANEDQSFCSELFRNSEGYFMDLGKVQLACEVLKSDIVVSDSVLSEIEKLSNPFYAKYIKVKNAEVQAKIEAEKARGGYFAHHDGDSEADSLLVELLKEHKGKAVVIDFWNTWCGPCISSITKMEPMKQQFEGQDVVFLYIADTSSPLAAYNERIANIKGVHHRLSENDCNTLKRKWNIAGIPYSVFIDKDGLVKQHGFLGEEYVVELIKKELNN